MTPNYLARLTALTDAIQIASSHPKTGEMFEHLLTDALELVIYDARGPSLAALSDEAVEDGLQFAAQLYERLCDGP